MDDEEDDRPLILTLGFEDAAQRRFDALRRAHFPAGRNHIPAHLTLFHALPGENLARVDRVLSAFARQTAPFRFTVAGVLDFGTGAALAIECPGLNQLYTRLQTAFSDILTTQDARPLTPHVTVQNKTDRATAKRTIAALRCDFTPWNGLAPRLDLWHYAGGPWEPARSFDLEAQT